ncbi:NADPH-dependent F420 reductase, partial [Spongiactinospora gelatinilytica]
MTLPAIAVVGGTGNLGAAIAWRLARAGYPVTIGSRNAESAEKAAAELGHGLRAGANVDVVANADIIIVTVPFAAQEATLRDIAPHVVGKLVVDTTVPLV